MNQGNTTTRSQYWEDEAPAEPRVRRMQQGVPRQGRAMQGMTQEVEDSDGAANPRAEWGRAGGNVFEKPPAPWWRPASFLGRVFLTLFALIVLAVLSAGGYILKAYMERDARFRIAGASAIQATGLTEVSRAEMLPVFGEDIGRNVFFVPLSERQRQLEAIPWVERATVMRLLPDQIRVQVVERQPVAFTRQGQQVGLVDANGVLLTMPAAAMAQHHYSFPVVTGINPGDSAASRKARMAVYARLMAELDAGNQKLSELISEIDLTDPEDARVLMPEQGEDILAHFGEDRFLERYQRYKAHIAEWKQQYPKLAAVDLRYDQQVVLEMASGVNAAQATGDPDAAASGSAGQEKAAGGELAAIAQGKVKPASGKPAAKGAPVENTSASPAVKPAGISSTRARTAAKNKTAKGRAAQNSKSRAQAKRAALKVNQRKPFAVTRPAAAVEEGQ